MRLPAFGLLFLPAVLIAAGPAYTVTTVAGGEWAGDGLPARSAPLGSPEGLAVDGAGALYVADSLDARIRKIAPDGQISTFAGTGREGFSGDGGPAVQAELNQPYGIAFDSSGALYVADLGNARVRRISVDGIIRTVAGGGTVDDPDGVPALSARFVAPRDLAFDAAGNLYVSDFGAHRVYRISTEGVVTRFAGAGAAGFMGPIDNIPALLAPLNSPAGLATDRFGRLYIADSGNGAIRVVAGSLLSTVPKTWNLAGQPTAIGFDPQGALWVAGKSGGVIVRLAATADKMAMRPLVNEPRGLAFAPDGSVYIADRLPGAAGVVTALTFGASQPVAGDGTFRSAGDGREPRMAHVENPEAVALDAQGNLYIAQADGRIRKVAEGTITTVATVEPASALAVDSSGAVWIAQRSANRVAKIKAGGSVAAAYEMDRPEAIAADSAGNVYVASATGALWKIDRQGVAAVHARAADLCGVTVAPDGTLYVADRLNRTVYRVSAAGALAPAANFDAPGRIAAGPDGVLLTDAAHHRVLRVSTGPEEAIGGTGSAGFGGDGGPASQARFSSPSDIVADAAGNLYVADRGNNRIRKLTPNSETHPIELSAIANAASMLPGPLVPGALMTLFGSGLGPPKAISGALETKLGGFEVLFDGEAAPLLYIQSRQVNFQVPYSIAGKPQVLIEVRRDNQAVLAIIAPVAPTAPGIFAVASGRDQAAAINDDGRYNSTAQPANRGSVLVFWATGEGQTAPQGITGALAAAPLPKPVLPVSVEIGGASAEILYAGAAPGFAGLMQVNVRVPDGIAPGTQPLEMIVGGVRSQAGVTVVIR